MVASYELLAKSFGWKYIMFGMQINSICMKNNTKRRIIEGKHNDERQIGDKKSLTTLEQMDFVMDFMHMQNGVKFNASRSQLNIKT